IYLNLFRSVYEIRVIRGLNSLTGIEAIPNPGLGEDVAGTRGVRLNLLTQVRDKHAQVFVLFDVISTPQRREQLSVCEHFSGMLVEVDQQIKLFRRQMNRLATHRDLTRLEIDMEIAGVERGLCGLIRGWRFR